METDFKNLYSVLGVEPSSDKNQIKAAYRLLAKKYHPDANKGNKLSEKKFKEITSAYEILSDDKKRREYDILNGFNKPKKETNSYTDPQKVQENYKKASSSKKQYTKPDTKKEKAEKNNGFSDFVEGLFFKKENVYAPQKGEDIFSDLTINVFEAQNGTTRNVNILKTISCPNCHGKKFINGSKCPKCNGTGEISFHKSITVKIPAGTINGSVISLKGEGENGSFGGENGNLNLKIIVENDAAFRFCELNVLSDIPITPTEAALGTTISVNTINGVVSMKIPQETSSGQKFRLHEQGVFDKETGKRGDHIVTVYIKMPKNLSPKEKELYNKLAQLRYFNPREK